MKSKPLGKGLQALFEDSTHSDFVDKGKTFLELPVEKIKLNHLQPREEMDPEQFSALKDSIEQKGLIQPIAVRAVGKHYEVVAGQRRLEAVKSLGRKIIPAYILEIANDKLLLEIALLENIRRVDLNPIEIAKGYKKLHEKFEMTQEEISGVFSVDRTSVTNTMRLLKLPKDIQDNLAGGDISMGHARAIAGMPTATEQKKLVKRIIEEGLSVRQTENLLKTIRPAKKEKKPKAKKSNAVVHLEGKLRNVLGSQVKIKSTGDGGKIEIEYYSLEDLDRLMEMFSTIENKY